MKKLLALVLALAMGLFFAGCNNSAATVLGSLEEKMPDTENGQYIFRIEVQNSTVERLSVEEVKIAQMQGGKETGTNAVFGGAELSYLGIPDSPIEPGSSLQFSLSPVGNFECEQVEITVVMLSESGNRVEHKTVYFVGGERPAEEGVQVPAIRDPEDSEHDENGFLSPTYTQNDWLFEMNLVNTGETPLTLVEVQIRHLMDGAVVGDPFIWTDLEPLGLSGLVLAPGESVDWNDAHPIVEDFNQSEYRFIFTEPNGNPVEKVFLYKLEVKLPEPVDHSGDISKDLLTLRYDADFEVEVFQGVYWVPANALGESRYTNSDIYAMLSSSPEEKQAKTNTLYEALQLYQVGGFYASDDNIRIPEGNIAWEHHKPGYDAVRTNTGCCATDSNWLRYILDGDYDEVGFIATSQRDGGGHIYNYIKQGGFYYFIDLTHYRTDWVATAVESGNLDDYYSSDFILGNIHKSATVEAFVDYVQSAFGDPPGLMFKYTAENCLAIDGVRGNNGITITYENTAEVEIIFDDPNDSLYASFVEPPKSYPDWSLNPGYNFP